MTGLAGMTERLSMLATGIAVAVFVTSLVAQVRLLGRRNREIAVGPVFVFAALCAVALYGVGVAADGLVAIAREVAAPYESFVERLLLGKIGALSGLLPLRARPLLAAPIHLGAALALYLALIPLCYWLGGCRRLQPGSEVVSSMGQRFWGRVFSLCGYRDLVGLEPRYRAWARPMIVAGVTLAGIGWFQLFYADPGAPPLSPYLWGCCAVLIAAAIVNLVTAREPEPASSGAVESPTPLPAPDPLEWIGALQRRGFSLSATPGRVLPPRPESAGALPVAHRTPLTEEMLAALAGGAARAARPWAHQAEVFSRVVEDGQHVLLVSPPGSGKTVIAQLLAAHTAISRGKNALFVLRDARAADEACDRLATLLRRTSWAANLRCTRSGADLSRLLSQRRTPVLTFAHPAALAAMLRGAGPGAGHAAAAAGDADQRYFLEHLGLVVFDQIERHSGVVAAHLYFVTRWLWAALGQLRASPRALVTLGVAARDFERYAETVTGLDLALVASDGAPRRERRLHPARAPLASDDPGSVAVAPAAAAAAEAAGLELPLRVLGFADIATTELERAVADTTRVRGQLAPAMPERARVSVAQLSAPRAARLVAEQARIGGDSAPGPHHQLLLPAPDPLSRWLAADLERLEQLARAGRKLIAQAGAQALGERYLRAVVAAGARSNSWARRVFGGSLQRLLDSGELSLRDGVRLEHDPPRLVPDGRIEAAARTASSSPVQVDTLAEEPVRLVDGATGEVLRHLDPERAVLVAYPGAVLCHRGRRFVVPLDDLADDAYAPGGTIDCQLLEQRLSTVRVRRLHVELLPGSELRQVSLGGEPVAGGLVGVRATEEVSAVRRHAADGALRGSSSFAPRRTELVTEAQVLVVGELAGEPALHALIHLLRSVLAALIDCGEEGLLIAHTADLAGRGSALLLIDGYSGGGVGYARAADAALLADALRLCQRILAEGCCEAGCPRCVRSHDCHQPDPTAADLDRAGAARLVTRLVGGA